MRSTRSCAPPTSIVDGPRRAAEPDARRRRSTAAPRGSRWRARGGTSSDPVVAALVDAGRRHDLPLGELDRYFDSMRLDCGAVRIETWAELERYMLGSAGSVGTILSALLERPADKRESFVSLALAFQLTNFIRDVCQDWELDRVYLPGEELARFEREHGGDRPPRAEPRLPRAAGPRGRARPRPVRRRGRGRAAREPRRPARDAPGPQRLRRGAGPRRAARLRRAAPPNGAAPAGGLAEAVAHGLLGSPMTRRATLRGAERTPIDRPSADVLVCGASFAGLAVARELAGSGADVLLVDRYEIGERATSACAAPLPWLEALGLTAAMRQEIPYMSFHTPHGIGPLPAAMELGGVRLPASCASCCSPQGDARFEIAKVTGAQRRRRANRPRRSARAARGGRPRMAARARAAGYQPPEAPLSRGLEVHPDGGGDDLDVWIERSLVRTATAGAFRPAASSASASAPTSRATRRNRPSGWRTGSAGRGPLPGQLVPPPAAPGSRGPRLLRRRLRRPLLPALGRGHPHRVLLRDRLRARAARRARRRAHARRGAAALRGLQRRSRTRLRARPAPPVARAAAPAACAHAGLRALGRQRLIDRIFGWYLDQADRRASPRAAAAAEPTVAGPPPRGRSPDPRHSRP